MGSITLVLKNHLCCDYYPVVSVQYVDFDDELSTPDLVVLLIIFKTQFVLLPCSKWFGCASELDSENDVDAMDLSP